MSYRRQQVESTLKRVISRVLARQLSDPRIVGMVSVTHVDVSPDWRHALVYVSVLPDKVQQKSVHGLRHAAGRIHSLVRKEMAMRVVPQFEFRVTIHLNVRPRCLMTSARALTGTMSPPIGDGRKAKVLIRAGWVIQGWRNR